MSIAGLLLPEAVAYSGIASLPPQAGVIALFAGLVCYGLIGRSRFAIVTATSSSAAVLASATLLLGGPDPLARMAFASILVVGTGLAFLLAASLRLGAISSLIARPVLRGYAFGLALVIAVKQWPHLVGMHAHSTGFFPLLLEIAQRLSDWDMASLACGAGRARRTLRARAPAARAGRTRGDRRQHRVPRRRSLPTAWRSPGRSTWPWRCRRFVLPHGPTGCRWSNSRWR